MRFFLGLCFFLLIASCQKNPPLAPIISAPLNNLYKNSKTPEEKNTLPSPHFRINLAIQDQPVETVLQDLANLADFPLGFDDEAALKAQQRHMSLVAHEAPLETLLNFCARAIDCQVTWWPHEPLVWIGNSLPSFQKEKKLQAWPLQLLLSEFQILHPPEVVTYQVDKNTLDSEIIQMRNAIKAAQEKIPSMPPLGEYLKEDLILSSLTKILEGENDKGWAQQLQTNNFYLENLEKILKNKKSAPSPETNAQNLVRFISSDSAWEPLQGSLSQSQLREWARDLVAFINLHPSLLKLSNILSLEEFEEWAQDLSGKNLNLETLQGIQDTSIRLKLYRKLELYRKLKIYNEKRQTRYDQIFSPIHNFAKKGTQNFENVRKKIQSANQRDTLQLRRYLTTRRREADQIISFAQSINSQPLDLKLLNQGDLMFGSVTTPQAHSIDILLERMGNPETLDIGQTLYKAETDQRKLNDSWNRLVNNNLQVVPIDTVLYRWALEAQMTLGWVVEDLPAIGQLLINRDNGLLPFHQSFEFLSEKFQLLPLHSEGNGCFWIGRDHSYRFNKPYPSTIRVFHIPASLRNNSTAYLADYFKNFFDQNTGFIEGAPNHRLVFALSGAQEERFLSLLAQAAAKGKLPQATILPKDERPR